MDNSSLFLQPKLKPKNDSRVKFKDLAKPSDAAPPIVYTDVQKFLDACKRIAAKLPQSDDFYGDLLRTSEKRPERLVTVIDEMSSEEMASAVAVIAETLDDRRRRDVKRLGTNSEIVNLLFELMVKAGASHVGAQRVTGAYGEPVFDWQTQPDV